MVRGVRAAAVAVVLCAQSTAWAADNSGTEIGAAASRAEHFARAFQQPLGALYRWLSTHPEASGAPVYSDLQPLMFAPPVIPGYEVFVNSGANGAFQLCVRFQLESRVDTAGFATAVGRVSAEAANPECTPDSGASARGTASPRIASMVRTVDARKVLSSPVLPAEPMVDLPTSGSVDLTNSGPSAVVTVTNNAIVPLQLQNATSSDPAFSLGSTCQVAMFPTGTCQIEVALSSSLARKRIGRVQLTFSNGSSAWFSVRGNP